MYKNLDKKKNTVTIDGMVKYNIYALWEETNSSFGNVFISKNDNMAVRHIVENHGSYAYFDKLKLWNTGKTFDVDNGDIGDCDKYVVSLPSADEALKQYISALPPQARLPYMQLQQQQQQVK